MRNSSAAAHFKALEERLPWEDVDVIKVRYLEPWQRAMLKHYGCVLEAALNELGLHFEVKFPAGTKKRECLPRVLSERYMIKLPNGIEIGEIIPRGKLSILGF